MSTIELLILGLALSMDAFAVTVSSAFVYRGTDKAHRLLMPVFFGVFQGLMPVIGFYAGSLVGPFIETYAGIITFVILGFIGGKMLWDAFHEEPEEVFDKHAKLTIPVLFFQAIATSIDALAVGVSFAALSLNIASAATLIGLTTALCCIVALIIGRHFGMKLGEQGHDHRRHRLDRDRHQGPVHIREWRVWTSPELAAMTRPCSVRRRSSPEDDAPMTSPA